MPSAPNPSLADFWRATIELLPRGIAWTRNRLSNVGKLVSVIAQERQTRHQRKLILLEIESVPTLAVELMPDWERALGLPDPCLPLPGTLAARWAAIADVFFADHPPTPENMIAWAATAGWNITIREQRDFIAGISEAGDTIGESDFVWVVTILDQVISFFLAGQAAGGDLLFTFPDIATLRCVLQRAAPAHTQITFIVP